MDEKYNEKKQLYQILQFIMVVKLEEVKELIWKWSLLYTHLN